MPVMMKQSPTSLQKFVTCPKQYEATYITKESVFQPNDHAKFGTLVHSAIEDYLTKGTTLPNILSKLAPTLDKMGAVLAEAETKLGVDKEGNATSYSKGYQRCVVDAILTKKDETMVVCIDWKTGKKRDAQIQHDFIKKCAAAKYPKAKEIITLFVYLFKGESDRQVYKRGDALLSLDRHMNDLAIAYANNSFPPKPSGLCKQWCDVMSCPHNGRA